MTPDATLGAETQGWVGTTAWRSWGTATPDAPPVLLLHGVTDDGACWAPVARCLATGTLVVAPDARGHGLSPLPVDEPFTVEAMAADVARVLREVVGRPALVVGHSMGGLVAQELALTEPELVTGLVLEDPAWVPARPATPTGAPAWLPDTVRRYGTAGLEELVAWSSERNPQWSGEVHVLWATAKKRLAGGLATVPQVWDARDWPEALGGVTVPVTLVTGDPRRGAIVTHAQVARAGELLGRCPDGLLAHVPIAGTGHCIRYDDPERFVEVLTSPWCAEG